MGSRRITPPATRVVSTDELKQQCRIETTAEDTFLLGYIDVATEHCENDCGRAFITQTWELSLPAFPTFILTLPRPPLQSITSVVYTDTSGVARTLPTADYSVDTRGFLGSIRPVESWPQTQGNNPAAVVVTFKAGYGDSAALVPAAARQAILLMAAYLYEFREPTITGTIVANLPLGIRSLLDPIRVLEG